MYFSILAKEVYIIMPHQYSYNIKVQRLLTVNSLRKAQNALWLNWPILTALSLTTSFAGLSMYSYYAHCDPLQAKRIHSPDQVIKNDIEI